jgi:hypothetical protein
MTINRRQMMIAGSMAIAGAATGRVVAGDDPAGYDQADDANIRLGTADHCISIWLGGGMSQIDTFDPKPVGDPKVKLPGAYYPAIETSVPGVQVCEHLPRVANLMHHVTAVRSVHHDTIDEHAAATNRMHTGRIVSGTVTYPSLGSVIAHRRGAADPTVPPYVLIGYPNITRGPGFLGATSGYLYLTDTAKGPAGLSRPADISDQRQSRRERVLAGLRKSAGERFGTDPLVADYDQQIERSLRLSGPEFNSVFRLDEEPDSLRNRYGGEFGQRCLLARRLTERGVRFIEVSHNLNFINGTGWDVHNDGIRNQHALIGELDAALATLIEDLEQKRLLDRTLIMISSEFGRPPEFDGGGGRGHQGSAFTCVLAGGGLRHLGAYGETDQLAKKIVRNPVSVPDLFATVHQAMGINPAENLFDGERPVPITDGGKSISDLFA